MSFDVAADAYGRFMGRFSEPLAPVFLDAVPVPSHARVLDVGAGTGALTEVLVERLGADRVVAVDPSAPFVGALRDRLPGVDVRRAGAERLPFEDAVFDVALAQLVVHFMSDPHVGVREMARVTRGGGTVATCVWDHAGGSGPLSTFWAAVHDLDPTSTGVSELVGSREGDLLLLLEDAGLSDVHDSVLEVASGFATFEEWWTPYTLGVGPAGAYVAGLDGAGRERLRSRCADLLPAATFTVTARAWCAVGRVPD